MRFYKTITTVFAQDSNLISARAYIADDTKEQLAHLLDELETILEPKLAPITVQETTTTRFGKRTYHTTEIKVKDEKFRPSYHMRQVVKELEIALTTMTEQNKSSVEDFKKHFNFKKYTDTRENLEDWRDRKERIQQKIFEIVDCATSKMFGKAYVTDDREAIKFLILCIEQHYDFELEDRIAHTIIGLAILGLLFYLIVQVLLFIFH